MSLGSGVTEAGAVGPLGTWTMLAPAGLTSTGRIRQFQDRTVQRLQGLAQEVAAPVFAELQQVVEQNYREGTGELAGTLQYKVTASRDGVEVSFSAGTNHVVYLTALAGNPTTSPGHWITAHGSKLRFFWKNPTDGGKSGVYAMKRVFWKPRLTGGRDVIGDVLLRGAQTFEQKMIRAHEQGLVQFVQENAQPATRSPRVTAFTGNDIPPQ